MTVTVNKENLKALLEYMYLDEWDFFIGNVKAKGLTNLDDFFREHPEYNECIMKHLHELSKCLDG